MPRYTDVAQQTEETEIQSGSPAQARAPSAQQESVDQVIDRHGDRQDHDHRNTQAQAAVDLFGDREKRAHAQEKGQRHVLDKDRANKRLR